MIKDHRNKTIPICVSLWNTEPRTQRCS